MPKFPSPPTLEALKAIGPEEKRVPKGTLLWRIYFQGGSHPTRWDEYRAYGPTGSRFDHQTPPPSVQTRAVLYAAEQGPTCLAEVFQTTRTIDRRDRAPWLSAFALQRDVVVHDLSGAWPTRAGASTAIHSGPRMRAREWSRALYDAFPRIEGLLYCSSMDANRPAFALYERARPAMPKAPSFHRALSDPAILSILNGAALRFNYAIV